MFALTLEHRLKDNWYMKFATPNRLLTGGLHQVDSIRKCINNSSHYHSGISRYLGNFLVNLLLGTFMNTTYPLLSPTFSRYC